MPARPPVATVLASLARVLDSAHLRWYVFGAQAVLLHGVVRQSADVDVTVEVDRSRLEQLVHRLAKTGFRPLIRDDLAGFIREARVIPLEHLGTGLPVDLVLAGPGPEAQFLGRAKRVKTSGVRVPVIALEDLIVLKVLAGRPKDSEDVRNLLRVRSADVDRGAVRARLRELELLLDVSDLVPAFDALVRAPSPAKRGSARRPRSR